MTINDKDKFFSTLWDWGFLDNCFGGTKIRVTDLDGFLERKGHFLVLETKSKGASVPLGQQIMFQNMQRSGLFTVIVIWGDTNKAEFAQVYYPNDTGPTKVRPVTNEDLQMHVGWWFNYATHVGVGGRL